MSNGTIVEIDLDSIHHNNNGMTTVDMGSGTMVLDCKGRRMGNGVMMIHIPELSIGWQIEKEICK